MNVGLCNFLFCVSIKNSLVIYRMSAEGDVVPELDEQAGGEGEEMRPDQQPQVGGKGRRTKKSGFRGKKSRKMNKSAKNWVSFVTEIFNKKRASNPNYKFKQAMKDASKLNKKNKSAKK
jgi:hypothetical protein